MFCLRVFVPVQRQNAKGRTGKRSKLVKCTPFHPLTLAGHGLQTSMTLQRDKAAADRWMVHKHLVSHFTQKPVEVTRSEESSKGWIRSLKRCRKAQIICTCGKTHTYLYFCEEHFQSGQVLLNYPILGKRGKTSITPHYLLLGYKRVYKNIWRVTWFSAPKCLCNITFKNHTSKIQISLWRTRIWPLETATTWSFKLH